jgi:hypothetical protein
VPITATRLPRRSTESSQRAVCMTVPAKSSTPGISGGLGLVSTPVAPIVKRAVISSPDAVSSRHSDASSSHAAAVIAVDSRSRDRSPYSSTSASAYARSSSPGA